MNEICAARFHNALKCADVFRTVDGEFHFVCDKCTQTTQDAVVFIQHLAQHFRNENSDPKQPVVRLRIMHVASENEQPCLDTSYMLKQEDYDLSLDGGAEYVDNDADDVNEYFNECLAGDEDEVEETIAGDPSPNKAMETKPIPIRIIPQSEIKTDVDERRPALTSSSVKKKRTPTKRDPMAPPPKSRQRSENHPCPDCSMKFKSEKMLSEHCLLLHSVRPFRCDQCPQTFSNTSKLNVHMNYHNKQLECDICQKKFALKSSIYFHLLTHVKEKQYECSFCGDKLRYKYQILQHKRKHGLVESLPGIVCELCGKTVQFPNQMREHMRRHNQHRVYKCTQCEKGFVNSGGLRTHFRRVHTDAVPFKCRWCDKMFRNYDARKAHERKMHDGQPMVVAPST